MESVTCAGLGIFKGRSLCLTANDTSLIHIQFRQLYLNKQAHGKEVRQAKTKEIMDEEQFSPKINSKSNTLA
jgi:hypothetical protein